MPLNLTPVKEKLNLRPVKESLSLKPLKDSSKTKLSLKPVGKLNIKPLGFSDDKNAFSKMSKFGKVLDILGRPAQAIKSLISAEQEKVSKIMSNPEVSDVEKFRLVNTTASSTKEAMQAMWRGFTGKERTEMNKVWEEVGVKGVPLLGFASEIAIDPLMYGGYSAITKTIGKGAGILKEGIKKIPGVVKVATTVGAKVRPVTSALKEMFITKTGLGKLNDLIDFYLSKRQYLKGQEVKFGIKTRNVIQNISRKTGQSIDDIEKQVVNLIERPDIAIPAATQETQVLANTLKSHFSNILTAEMKAGVPIAELGKGREFAILQLEKQLAEAAKKGVQLPKVSQKLSQLRVQRNIQYFPRITTKEAQEYLKQAKIGNSKVWNPRIANALRRRTGDFTLEEFNSFVREHGLESLGGKSVEEFFIKNPAYAVAARGARSAKAVTSAQFLDDVGRNFGKKDAPAFWQELPENVTKLNPSLKGLKFDPEVTGEITRVTQQYINPQQAKIFMRTFDKVQNTWKRWTLAPFPKFHLRNMVGNIWNNHLAGVDPKHYGRAQAIQMYRKYKSSSGSLNRVALENLKKFGITPQIADDIIVQAEKTGVLGQGWFAADIETGIRESVAKKGLISKGLAFGSTIENNARLAHFLDKLNKGDDTIAAAKSVKKFLFDYGELTAFERQIMKRLFPFYTWTRKNIPLQAEQLWKQPEKFMKLAIPLRARDEQDLLRLKYARPSLYERLPVEVWRTAETVTYMPLEGVIPAADLSKMVRPQEIFVELLTPFLRAPIELAMNKSFFFESEIQRYPKETQELLRADIPVKLKYVLTTVLPQARLLNEINKLVRKNVRKQELTPGEQALSQSLSSIYKVNIKDLRERALRNLEKKANELQQGMFWAKRNKRPKEEIRIRETYLQLKQMIKEVKGD